MIEVVNCNWALTYVRFMDERAFDYMLNALFVFETIPESAKIIDKYVKVIEIIADNMVYCTLDKCKI